MNDKKDIIAINEWYDLAMSNSKDSKSMLVANNEILELMKNHNLYE